MTETREQFRQRVINAYNDGAFQDAGHEDCDNCRNARIDGYQAVYAECLRDVMTLATEFGDVMAVDIYDLMSFAATRGINLDDGIRDMSGYTAADYSTGRDNQP